MSFFSDKKQYTTPEEQGRLTDKIEKEEYLADTRVPLSKRVKCCLLPCCSFECTCDPSYCDSNTDEEGHKSTSGTAQWLRAAVLGANDSLVSVAAIMVGVAASENSTQGDILLAGLSGLVAGAMSMAVGEYVSVCSQADLEDADLEKEKWEIENNYEGEVAELSELYQARGLEPELADQVARKLMEKDALQAHAIEELGIRDFTQAAPWQAAFASFIMFMGFGCIPFLAGAFIPDRYILIGVVSGVTLLMLALSGALGSYFGGAAMWRGALRVTVGGALAIGITFGAGVITEYTGLDELNF